MIQRGRRAWACSPMAVEARASELLKGLGDWLQRRQAWVRRLQWGLVLCYYTLLFVPAILPQPADRAEALSSLAGVAEIIFWGFWWPAVILSMMLFGQFWCGVFCPDGALTEWASRYGKGGKVPAWVRWGGWPLLLFSVVLLYEHLVNAHQAPRALVFSLGAASLLALACGYLFGRGKRIWCRYLCPASSVFSLLARCAIFHFRTDRDAWDSAPKPLPRAVDCPLLLDVRRLRGNEKCSMCGRCSGHRGAVQLAWRPAGSEILHLAEGELRQSDVLAILLILVGLGYGVLHGAQGVFADWLGETPARFVGEGGWVAILMGMLSSAALLAALMGGALWLVSAGQKQVFMHLSYTLIPLGGFTLFLGALGHGMQLFEELLFSLGGWRSFIRSMVLMLGLLWSGWLSCHVMALHGRPFASKGLWLCALWSLAFLHFHSG